MTLSDNERLGAALLALLGHLRPDGIIELGRNWANGWRLTYESLGDGPGGRYSRASVVIKPTAASLAEALERLAKPKEAK